MNDILKFFPWENTNVNTKDMLEALCFSNSIKLGFLTLIIFFISYLVINNVSIDPTGSSNRVKMRKYWWGYLFFIIISFAAWNYWLQSSLITNLGLQRRFLNCYIMSVAFSGIGYIILSYVFIFFFKKTNYGGNLRPFQFKN